MCRLAVTSMAWLSLVRPRVRAATGQQFGNHYELRDLQPADLPAISEGLPTHFRFDGRPLEQLPRAAREILE